MKAVLLAAGLGTRLRPLTDHVPKCLVPVRGKALLDIWLDSFTSAGVDEVLINLHHFPDLVRGHLASRHGGPRVVTAYEPTLLGSAGTLRAQRDWLAGEEMFLVVNGDNLTDFDLRDLVDAHRSGGAVATLSVFRTPRPRECGIVEVVDGWVTGFQEKPQEPRGDLANAGLYAFVPDVIDRVRPGVPRDIGFDLLPGLVGEARAVDIGDAYFLDVGTPEALVRATREWGAVELG
ncbi:nucleotidyltransferase family protein [Nocardioides sediminis]|uniref:nucleotidyltransferase family protein n=1 Tax=Nocardioides sediminis TaxID=433648 RepID=UPI000D307F19|nr:nucleotidyltransferase family protein [Nocardioides sediminis]